MTYQDGVTKTMRFSDRHTEMIRELKDKYGYTTFSEVIKAGLVELYKKSFPVYAEAKREMSPTEKVERKEAVKQAIVNVQDKLRTNIALELGGVVEEKDGGKFCRYYTYSAKTRYEQRVPFHMLTDDLIKNQYSPSKEKVLKLQKAGKVDYEV